MTGSALAAQPDGSIHVIVLDVGQGDAILLEGDRGGRILVDGGPDQNVLISRLDGYIPAWDRRLDAIVLTHPHDDHVAGLVGVIERYHIGRAFESGWSVDTPAYRAWKAALSAHGLLPERLRTGETVRLDDAALHVLWPDDGTTRSAALDPAATSNRQTNDASLVLLGEFEDRRFLLTGDAEDDVDPILLSRGLPTVDMLKVAHHGSATASSEALLAALRPSVAVISVGAGNTYGHPNGGTLARLQAHSSKVTRTDLDGSVEVTLDRAAVTVAGSRGRSAAASASETEAVPFGLLYDSIDVRPKPSRERGLAPVVGTTGLAPPPFAGGRRDCRLAGVAGCVGRSASRSPPGRIGGVAA
jgi:competence protein ComEC